MASDLEPPSTVNHEESAERHADLSLIQALRSELESSAAAQADAVDKVRNQTAQEIHTLQETIQSLRDKLEEAAAATSAQIERTRAETAACQREMHDALSALRVTLQTEKIAAANRLEADHTSGVLVLCNSKRDFRGSSSSGCDDSGSRAGRPIRRPQVRVLAGPPLPNFMASWRRGRGRGIFYGRPQKRK